MVAKISSYIPLIPNSERASDLRILIAEGHGINHPFLLQKQLVLFVLRNCHSSIILIRLFVSENPFQTLVHYKVRKGKEDDQKT
jgi:hypothetical protein